MWGVAEWTEHNNHNWFMEYKGSKSVLPYIPYGGVYGCVKTSLFSAPRIPLCKKTLNSISLHFLTDNDILHLPKQ